jgi:cellulose synthase operon protein YhjQ
MKPASMQVIAFISGKGGVGKTTLAANVAIALAQMGKRVLLIDLDPQNAMRLHLGMDPLDIAGIVREGICPRSIFRSPFGAHFIPFGIALRTEMEEFEVVLKERPAWVLDQLSSFGLKAFDFIILDTPPGPSVFLQQALLATHLALGVVLPDAASFATIPRLLSLVQEYTRSRRDFYDLKLLVNQVSEQNQLGQQFRVALQADYEQYMVPIAIRRAAAVSEALAFEQPLLQFDSACSVNQDIARLANWLNAHIASAQLRVHQAPHSFG